MRNIAHKKLSSTRKKRADTLSSRERGQRMALIRGKNTKPEVNVRRIVHRLGYRFRLHGAELPGKPDIVFRPRKKVIFVHGCFWHRHPDPNCKLARWPKTRLDFWRSKLIGNYRRDRRNLKELSKMGWQCLVIWECELGDLNDIRMRLWRFLSDENH